MALFGAVLKPRSNARSNIAGGAAFSLLVHAALLAAVLVAPPVAREALDDTFVDVTLFDAAPPAAPPPLGGEAGEKPQPTSAGDATPAPTPSRVLIPRLPTPVEDQPKPADPEPTVEPIDEPVEAVDEPVDEPVEAIDEPVEEPVETADPGKVGRPDGVKDGKTGGTPGGDVAGEAGGKQGGKVGGKGTRSVRPFGPGMQRPRRIAGRDPRYTKHALAARVQGLIIAQCVINPRGRLVDCMILKGLPFMDDEVLEALGTLRYTPVRFQGKPVSVRYNFKFRMRLP